MSRITRAIIVTVFVLLSGLIFLFGVRGLPGNPDIQTLLQAHQWVKDGPLELSPERGRYALLYSIVEDKSLHFSVPVAILATPDLGMNEAGQYVSLFAPGVSFLAIPGYLLGKMLGASQVGAYLVISFFAILNMLLIRSMALRLGARYFPALLAALTFGFATPAFAYGVNLYQHHISVFVMLLALYLLIRFQGAWVFASVWLLCSLSVVIDNPNLFLMLPIGLYAVTKLGKDWYGEVARIGATWKEMIRSFRYGITFLALFIPLGFFFWYNQAAYGHPLQLPGTLRGVDEIGLDGKPVTENTYEKQVLTEEQKRSQREGSSKEKTAVGFFETRNLYEGFRVHFLSPDRGILSFAPVVLLGMVGLGLLYRRRTSMATLMIGVIGMNVLTYSMWGDPQGGWAFGSRYLIPSYALLSLGIAFPFSEWKWKKFFLVLFIPLFIYSAWVNSLGAVTSSANPPKVEVLSLEKQTGHEQKYTFLRNWEFLHQKYEKVGSKSFLYQAGLKHHLSALEYQSLVFGLVLFTATLLGLGFFLEGRVQKKAERKTQNSST